MKKFTSLCLSMLLLKEDFGPLKEHNGLLLPEHYNWLIKSDPSDTQSSNPQS